MDHNDNIIKIYLDQDLIENKIIEHNINYFQKTYQTDIYYKKIYSKLQNDAIRNKFL